ncbi:Uncharacterized protein APZ42_010651, partial [Daphnia magna]
MVRRPFFLFFLCFLALAFTREGRLRLTSGAPSGGDVNAAPSEHGRSATRRETPFTCMSYKKLNSFKSTEKNKENGPKRPFRHEAISSFDSQRSRDDFWPSDWLGKQVKTVFDVKGDQAGVFTLNTSIL